jgi:hypothetical protein
MGGHLRHGVRLHHRRGPDDDLPRHIRVLGSITGGIIGFAVNLAVFLIVSAITGQSAEERHRVAQLLDAAKRTAGQASKPQTASPALVPKAGPAA